MAKSRMKALTMGARHQRLLEQIAETEDRSQSSSVRQMIEFRAVQLGLISPSETPTDYLTVQLVNGHSASAST